MEISPARTGTQLAIGGAVGGTLVSLKGMNAKVTTYGVAAGGAGALAQSLVYQKTGNGLASLGAGVGGGAVVGAALFHLFTAGNPSSEVTALGRRSPVAAIGVGLALGAGLGLVSSFAGFVGATALFGETDHDGDEQAPGAPGAVPSGPLV